MSRPRHGRHDREVGIIGSAHLLFGSGMSHLTIGLVLPTHSTGPGLPPGLFLLAGGVRQRSPDRTNSSCREMKAYRRRRCNSHSVSAAATAVAAGLGVGLTASTATAAAGFGLRFTRGPIILVAATALTIVCGVSRAAGASFHITGTTTAAGLCVGPIGATRVGHSPVPSSAFAAGG